MALCDQWFIYGKINKEPPAGYDYENKKQPYYDPKSQYGAEIIGGLKNGYKLKDLENYNKKVADFCTYLFNKSHACSYSFLTISTMYMKFYHAPEYFAALLSLQDKQEDIELYCRTAKKYNIKVLAPDINISGYNFTVHNGNILYGLNKIKNVGKAAPVIIEKRPFISIEDAYERAVSEKTNSLTLEDEAMFKYVIEQLELENDEEEEDIAKTKKVMNKRVGNSIIKAGGFDFINKNRNKLLNDFIDIRKAKKDERFNEELYDKNTCVKYEIEILGAPITYESKWDNAKAGDIINVDMQIVKINEKYDKRNNLMANLTVKIGGQKVAGLIFSSIYVPNKMYFSENNIINVKIKKDKNNKFLVDEVLSCKFDSNISTEPNKEIDNVICKMIG